MPTTTPATAETIAEIAHAIANTLLHRDAERLRHLLVERGGAHGEAVLARPEEPRQARPSSPTETARTIR